MEKLSKAQEEALSCMPVTWVRVADGIRSSHPGISRATLQALLSRGLIRQERTDPETFVYKRS